MRNVAPRRRRVVSLTALIDVVFLLLLFFMLTSTFSSFGEIELFPPAGGQAGASEPQQRAFLQLGAELLTLNGETVALDALVDQIDADLVLIDLEEGVSSQRLVDVLALFRGNDDLSVLVLE
ncbi:MAG: ExbD/TolR family protein [Arenibacterium sp.]